MKLDLYTRNVSDGFGSGDIVHRPGGWKSRPRLIAAAAGAVAMLALMLLLTAPILSVEEEAQAPTIDARMRKLDGGPLGTSPGRRASILDRMLAKMEFLPPWLSGSKSVKPGGPRRESILRRLARTLAGGPAAGETGLGGASKPGEPPEDASEADGKKGLFAKREEAGQASRGGFVSAPGARGTAVGQGSPADSLANAPKMPSFAASFAFARDAARVPAQRAGGVRLPQFTRAGQRTAPVFASAADAFLASMKGVGPAGASSSGHLASPGKPSPTVETPAQQAHDAEKLRPLASAGPSLGVRAGVVQGQPCDGAADCNGAGESGAPYLCVNLRGRGFRWENDPVGCGGGYRHNERMTESAACGGRTLKCCPNPIEPLLQPGGWRLESEPCTVAPPNPNPTPVPSPTLPPPRPNRSCSSAELFEEKTLADGTNRITAICVRMSGLWQWLDVPPMDPGDPQVQPPCPTTNTVTCIEYSVTATTGKFGAPLGPAFCKGTEYGSGPQIDWMLVSAYQLENPGAADPCK